MIATSAAALAQRPAPQLSAEDFGRLAETLRGEPQRPMKVRLQAALILGRSSGPDAVSVLVECVEADPDYPVRAACALALGNAGDARAVEPLFGRLEDEEQLVRDEARRALARLASPESMPYFHAAREQGSPLVRQALAELVAGMEGAEAGQLLAELLGDRDEEVRERASAAFAKLSPAAADELLMRSLEHSNYRVKIQAATLLGKRRHAPAVEPLIALAGSPLEAVEVQAAARGALRELRGLFDAGQLSAEARDLEIEKRRRLKALVVLSALGGPEAFQLCLDLLSGDPDVSLRGSATQALAEIGNPRALPALREAEKKPENARIAKVIGVSIRKLERSGAP